MCVCVCACESNVINYVQVSICLRYVDPQTLQVHEDCIGLYATDRTDASTIAKLTLDLLVRFNLPVKNCRGQCYDGAANMAGRRAGVAAKIKEVEPRALYIHCMGHSLNLAVQDTSRSVSVINEALDTVLELSKIFKYSAKKKSMLLQVKSELAPDCPGLKPLCPTRWTVRAESLRSVLNNYAVIQSVLEEIVHEYREATASARGVRTVMEKFSFLFGVTLAEKVFSLTDRLSRALQAKRLFAVEAKKYVAVTMASLKDLRNDSTFDEFWSGVKQNAEKLDVDEPILPRKRKAPTRFDSTSSTT